MFLFGHLGITLGIAFLLVHLVGIESNRRLYSFILIGAILPDLIDKPIGEIMLANSLSNGRLFAHTFLFIFLLLLVGAYIQKRSGENGGLALCFASFIHLCEDQMWLMPEILFYPFFGFDFPQGIVEGHWLDYFLGAFFRTYSLSSGLSYAFVSEWIGIFILVIFMVHWISIRRFSDTVQ
jgi:hypothetical protein